MQRQSFEKEAAGSLPSARCAVATVLLQPRSRLVDRRAHPARPRNLLDLTGPYEPGRRSKERLPAWD